MYFIIYKITNLINGKIYIGQTTNSLDRRWYGHLHKSKYLKNALYSAINKYGVENFKIEEIDGANSQTELNYKEWLWIHKENCLSPNGYNLKEGGGSKGFLVHEVKLSISKTLKGRKMSLEVVENMTKATRNRIGKYGQNKNSIKAIVEAGKKQSKPIVCKICGVQYPSITQAANFLKTSTSNVRKNIRGEVTKVKTCDFRK